MPSLERFFNPQMRVFSANITSMPSARLYFFEAGSTTPKVTYADKQGTIPNAHPVVASSTGTFPPIFLDGLYRAELRSSGNIVQPGWPIDNVGQDIPIVPYAPWSELVTYAEFERVTDPLTGIVYRSLADNNLGNVPASSPSDWEVVIDPVPSSFTSDAAYLSWSDDGGQISLDVDQAALNTEVAAGLVNIPNTLELDTGYLQIGLFSDTKTFFRFDGHISSDDVTYYPILTSAVLLAAPLPVDQGGTGGNTQALARTGLGLGTAAVKDYVEQNATITGSGNFTSGVVKFSKVGRMVTISSSGAMTHSSLSNANSASGFVPAAYRPAINEFNVYYMQETPKLIAMVQIAADGTLNVQYLDFTGTAVNSSTTVAPINISYNVV